ncbi:MAG: phosphoribosylglycinamide formyltransferase [Mariprofundaceae bacterium]|nr:phosphoribosylglycinamide formyltransferase [Mariprofundaceae bacterium]
MSTAIAVMASGKGSNLQAILAAITAEECAIKIELVISDCADATALDIARQAGVAHVLHLAPSDYPDRQTFDAACAQKIQSLHCEWVILAGYMRILSREFVQIFPEKIINIHPSLLPAFSGAHAVRDALNYGVKITGCTVHLVEEELDSGPILAQTIVPVFDDDDEESLHQRIHQGEHILYPQVLSRIAQNGFTRNGRHIVWNQAQN